MFLRDPRGVGIAVGIHGFVRRADELDSGKANHQFLDVAQPVSFAALFQGEAETCFCFHLSSWRGCSNLTVTSHLKPHPIDESD